MINRFISSLLFIKNNFLQESWWGDNWWWKYDKWESLSRLRWWTSSVLKRLEWRWFKSYIWWTEKQQIRNFAEVCMWTEFESEFLYITWYTQDKVYYILQKW